MYKFLIVDDHSIVITGLRVLIRQEFPSPHIEAAHDGDSTIARVRETKFDIIVLDINMDNTNITMLIETIFIYHSDARILIFTISQEEVFAKKFLRLGVMGYLNKECHDSEIMVAIRTILGGKKYLSEKLTQMMTGDGRLHGSVNPFDLLSDRELDITLLIIRGKSLSEISRILNLHTSTVGTHKSRIFEKLKITNVIELTQMGKMYNIY